MIVSVNNSIILCFNPRTHGGYDVTTSSQDFKISVALIPVPTEGTIRSKRTKRRQQHCFNPRTHGGYDGEII